MSSLPKLRYFVRPVSSSSVIKNTVEKEEAENLYPGFSASGQDVWVPYFDYEGDALILSAVGARCGRTFMASGRWGTVANTQALLLEPRADQRFFWYLTNSPNFWERGGAAQPYVKTAETLRRRVSIPDLPTQKTIAAFLDRETLRIDQLIEKKQRLVELLTEREEAGFLNIVTGKDGPGTKRNSGVEWIGDIPVHWSAPKFTQVARQETGHTPSRRVEEYWKPDECTIPWVSLADVWQLRSGENVFIEDTKEKISPLGIENSSARILPQDTVVLSRTASVGFVGILAKPMATTQDFAAWVCGPALKPRYLYYVLRSMKPVFRRLMMGSTHQTIYMPDIRAFRSPLPPLAEQEDICERLDHEIARFRRVILLTARSIDRLKEYRSALITAAVTGQIDVETWSRRGKGDRRLDRIEEEMAE